MKQIDLDKRTRLNSFLIALLLNVKSFPVVFGEISSIVIIGVAVIYLALLVVTQDDYVRGRRGIAIAVPIILLVTGLLNILMSSHQITQEYVFSFFGLGVPFLFLPVKRINLELIVKYFSYIGIAVIPFYYGEFQFIQQGDDELLMAMSYRILPFIISSLIVIFSYKNKIAVIVLEIISVLFYTTSLLSFGSRGTIVCVLAFCIIYYVCSGKTVKAKLRRIVISAGLLVALVVTFSAIINRLVDADFSMRSVERMYFYMSSERDVTSGRDSYYIIALKEFQESPIWGNGIGSFNNYCGIYPHNVLIQIMQELGLLFTLPFIYCLFLTFLTFIRRPTSDPYNICLFFLFFSGVLGLFFSQNFWGGYLFWTYIWMLLNEKQLTKQNKLIETSVSFLRK